MAWFTYHPALRCKAERGGFRSDQYAVTLQDVDRGREQYLIIDETMVMHHDDGDYLAVGIVEVDHRARRALVELPAEADSGINRMWVGIDSLLHEPEPDS